MKNNKLNMVWIAGGAALVILLLLLTMCTSPKEENVKVLPAETMVHLFSEPTEMPTVSAEATEETTAPTEETAETTEATEETEETTAPTTGNNNSGNSGNTGTTKPTEPALKVPDAGTEKNPYVEVVSEYPGKVTTVKIPAKGTISYLISGSGGNVITIENPNAKVVCGEKTYTPDENGILTVDLADLTADAVIVITNAGAEELTYDLLISEPLGAKTNPIVLDDLAEIAVNLKADDADGLYYQWTAPAAGTLKLGTKVQTMDTVSAKEMSVDETAGNLLLDLAKLAGASEKSQGKALKTAKAEETTGETVETVAVLSGVDVIVTAGDKNYKLSEAEDSLLTLELEKHDRIQIQVVAKADAEGKYPASETVLTGSFALRPGTEDNPYELTLTEIPSSVQTVVIPAESQVYYNIIGAGGTVLTIADNACVIHGNVTYGPVVNNSVWVKLPESENGEAILLAVGNQNETEKSLTLNFAYEFTAACPGVLHGIETIEASLPEGNGEGFYYQWTAADPGTVKLNLESITPETAACDVKLSISSTDRSTRIQDGTASIDVLAGETLIICISVAADENGTVPAAQVKLSGSFLPAPGTTAENPIVISDLSSPATVSVDEGRTVYLAGLFCGKNLTIESAFGATLDYDGKTYSADENGTITLSFPEAEGESSEDIALSITSEYAWEYVLIFKDPLGSPLNPEAMVLGDNQAVLEENDEDGYSFSWYADIEGELTITMPEGEAWQYTLDGVSHNSAEAPVTASNTIPVTTGQQVLFTVNTFAPEKPDSTPAGTVRFAVSFYDPTLGTEANPISLELTDTVTIPAGQTVYYTAKADGMTLTLTGENVKLSHNGAEYTAVDGKLTLLCKGEGMMMPPVFAITNLAEEEASYTLEFTYPLGHAENPAKLQLGETKITLEAGNEVGYCFTWTAGESGSLTITMPEGTKWQYVVNNLTSGVSGELHTGSDEQVVSSETITVSAGDEISIIVNTFDPENPFAPPGGELTFRTEFVPA